MKIDMPLNKETKSNFIPTKGLNNTTTVLLQGWLWH